MMSGKRRDMIVRGRLPFNAEPPGRVLAGIEITAVDADYNRWAWRLWSITVQTQPGRISVTARAWDDTGVTHPETPASLWNPRGYGNNAWAHVKASVR
jgi:hypothetical protein